MHGWDRLTNLCGLGCKVFWHPWSSGEKPYGPVLKLDDLPDTRETAEGGIVTNEPQKPVWSDMKVGNPIVRNKANNTGNVRSNVSYGKLPSEIGLPKVDKEMSSKASEEESRVNLSVTKVAAEGSRISLVASKSTPLGSRTSLVSSKGASNGSRSSLVSSTNNSTNGSKSNLSGSRKKLTASEEKLHVAELVTTV